MSFLKAKLNIDVFKIERLINKELRNIISYKMNTSHIISDDRQRKLNNVIIEERSDKKKENLIVHYKGETYIHYGQDFMNETRVFDEGSFMKYIRNIIKLLTEKRGYY